ncbi:hypothetical protein HVY71_26230 (plasmid) [Citrobacter freundii]|nr:hypothetical protein HVY71_26230 [Citrobacter freundii]
MKKLNEVTVTKTFFSDVGIDAKDYDFIRVLPDEFNALKQKHGCIVKKIDSQIIEVK